MTPLIWIDVAVLLTSMLLAVSLALLVVFSNPKLALNWFFGLFALAIGSWYGFSLLLRGSLWFQIGDPQLLLGLSTVSFALSGPPLLMFAGRLAGCPTRRINWFSGLGFAMLLLLCVPILRGQLIDHPRLHPQRILLYDVSPAGFLSAILPLAFMAASFALFWRQKRKENGLRLEVAVLLIILGFIAGVILESPFPIMTFASASGTLVLGYEIINRQVLNPYKSRSLELEREMRERRRAERALQESENRFRSIYENAIMGIYRITPYGRILMANPAMLEMLGLASMEEAARLNLETGGFKQQPSRAVFKQRMESDSQVAGMEFVWLHEDGKNRIVRESARAIRDEDGEILYYEGIVEDITSRIQIERALQRSLAELQNIQQITESLLQQDELYETMRTVARGIVDKLGYEMVLISRYIEEDQEFTGLALHPLPTPEVFGQILRLTGYENILDDPQKFQVRYRRGDNELVDRVLDGEMLKSNSLGDLFYPWFSRAHASIIQRITGLNTFIDLPMRVSGKAVGTIVAGVRDDNIPLEQVHALVRVADQAAMALERARLLAETQRQLRAQIAIKNASAVISSALELGVVLNRIAEQMGQAVDTTSAYISSYDIDSMLSTVLAEYISPNATARELVSDLGESYLDNDPDFLQAMLVNYPFISHFDSDNLTASEHISMGKFGAKTILYIPLLVANRLIGIVELWESRRKREFTPDEISLCRGIAQQAAIAIENARLHEQVQNYAETLEARVAERTAQLEAANRELQAFSYSVSHDLRAPLRGIDGYSQALLEEYAHVLDEQGQEYICRVRQSAQKMGTLIDDILNLSRITCHEMDIQPVDVSALVGQIVEEIKTAEPKRRIEFEIAAGLAAMADRHLLMIALRNLVGNAVKFTSRKPVAQIVFGAREIDGESVFYIQDNGAGFDMAYREKLFDAFYRLHGEHEFPGTGIGLSIVQRVINKHQGCIWAESKEGDGATFYFTLGEFKDHMYTQG